MLSFIKKRALVFYEGPSGVVYDGLLLSVEASGAFYNEDFLISSPSVEGFRGVFADERDLFFSSLKDGFKNQRYKGKEIFITNYNPKDIEPVLHADLKKKYMQYIKDIKIL